MEAATKKPARAANGTGRTRAYYGYSRTGCARCKQQRVRCDEQHPECDRCVRVGIACPGYEQKLRWSAKHEVFRPEQGQKKQQARRKQAPKDAAAAAAAAAAQKETPYSAPALPAFQQPLPSPVETSTPATPPAAQLTSSSGSPDSDTALPPAVPLDSLRSPAWARAFDPLPAAIPDFPDMYMGMSSPLFAAQRALALDAGAVFHGNMMAASAGLGPAWAGGLSAGASMAMPAMMPALAQQAADPAVDSQPDDYLPVQEDAIDVLLRGGRWTPPPQSHADAAYASFVRSPETAGGSASADRESVGDASGADFGGDALQTLGALDAPGAPASKTQLQLMPYAGRQPSSSPPLSTVSLNDCSTVLVEFYFKVTAQVYSCYDSRMNPFRSAVVRAWSSSRILYCTLRSMAAASLVRDFPQVAPVGRQLRQEAASLLASTTAWDVNSMLAILMLGGTSGWHNPRDLGLPFFNQIARCLATEPASTFGGEESGHRSYRFFRESMLYWEMLLAFVADNDTISTVPDERPDAAAGPRAMGPETIPGPRFPHPWTGFCAETQLAVLKVGRLVRRQRKFDYGHRFASMAHISQLQRDMDTARELEAWLVRIAHPTEQSVKDTEDRNTPVWHLLTLAEIIRDTGLAQLYHVFPDLLSARLRRERGDEQGDCAPDEPDVTQEERRKWLTAFTLRSLEMMKTLPIESGTRDFQPFLLVALCSGLRINKTRRPAAPTGTGAGAGASLPLHALLNLDMETVEVTRARGFVHSRLTAFLHALPPKPILACLDIVQQTWKEMDEQEEARCRRRAGGQHQEADVEADVYWMDVMIQNGWETIMA